MTSDYYPASSHSVTYRVNEPGATCLKDARPMTIQGRTVTAQTYGSQVSVFVGTLMAYDGDRPWYVDPGSPAFYAWVRKTAIDWDEAQTALEWSRAVGR